MCSRTIDLRQFDTSRSRGDEAIGPRLPRVTVPNPSKRYGIILRIVRWLIRTGIHGLAAPAPGRRPRRGLDRPVRRREIRFVDVVRPSSASPGRESPAHLRMQ